MCTCQIHMCSCENEWGYVSSGCEEGVKLVFHPDRRWKKRCSRHILAWRWLDFSRAQPECLSLFFRASCVQTQTSLFHLQTWPESLSLRTASVFKTLVLRMFQIFVKGGVYSSVLRSHKSVLVCTDYMHAFSSVLSKNSLPCTEDAIHAQI